MLAELGRQVQHVCGNVIFVSKRRDDAQEIEKVGLEQGIHPFLAIFNPVMWRSFHLCYN